MPAKQPEGQRREDTLWKLVETQCVQLADAVAAARRPFFLALSWAFIWATALYTAEFGDINHFRDAYQRLNVLASDDAAKEDFKTQCDAMRSKAVEKPKSPQQEIALCKNVIAIRSKWLETSFMDSALISLPGGFGKLSVSDLGIVGQVGLLLVLSWCFFSTRRENHAVRAFVDMDQHSRKITHLFAKKYVLEPQAEYLLAEHFAYAYRSVAQRFMFLFSQHSKPLLAFSMILYAIPAIVAACNMYTDARDLTLLLYRGTGIFTAGRPAFKMAIEAVLLVLVWIMTYRIIRFDIETSMLLNGWQLAVSDVWMKDWARAERQPAAKVTIDVLAQKAFRVVASNPNATDE